VAVLITEATGVEVDVVEGSRGEFSVRVGDEIVARKDARGFPRDDEVVAAVQRALGPLDIS
jgi:hypothetical protein